MALRVRRIPWFPVHVDEVAELGMGEVITGRYGGCLRELMQDGPIPGVNPVVILVEEGSGDRLEIPIADRELANQFEAAAPTPGNLIGIEVVGFMTFKLTVKDRAVWDGFRPEPAWSEIEDEEEPPIADDEDAHVQDGRVAPVQKA